MTTSEEVRRRLTLLQERRLVPDPGVLLGRGDDRERRPRPARARPRRGDRRRGLGRRGPRGGDEHRTDPDAHGLLEGEAVGGRERCRGTERLGEDPEGAAVHLVRVVGDAEVGEERRRQVDRPRREEAARPRRRARRRRAGRRSRSRERPPCPPSRPARNPTPSIGEMRTSGARGESKNSTAWTGRSGYSVRGRALEPLGCGRGDGRGAPAG